MKKMDKISEEGYYFMAGSDSHRGDQQHTTSTSHEPTAEEREQIIELRRNHARLIRQGSHGEASNVLKQMTLSQAGSTGLSVQHGSSSSSHSGPNAHYTQPFRKYTPEQFDATLTEDEVAAHGPAWEALNRNYRPENNGHHKTNARYEQLQQKAWDARQRNKGRHA